jgi:hypothetical protein
VIIKDGRAGNAAGTAYPMSGEPYGIESEEDPTEIMGVVVSGAPTPLWKVVDKAIQQAWTSDRFRLRGVRFE